MPKPPVGLTLTGADADLSLLSFYFIFVPGGYNLNIRTTCDQ
jgi:hypothetical protein